VADPNIGQVAASAFEAVVGKKPTDNIFKSRAFFMALGADGFKEEVPGGRLFEMDIEYAENASFKSYSEMETLDTTRYDVFDAARYDQKICAGTVVYSNLEELRNAEPNRKFDLIAGKLENGKNSHISDLNRQCLSDGTGNGGKDITGIQALISTTPTTGTVGGINRATFSFWRNVASDGGKTTAAFDNLRSSWTTVYNTCSRGGVEDAPTSILCDQTTFQGYEGTLVLNARYQFEGSASRGGNAGFKNRALKFKDADVYYDEDAPTGADGGRAYFLSPKWLKFMYLRGGWMHMYPQVDPANQLANVHKVATYGNLGTNNSRRLGVSFGID
jgi:hypothetical protein